MYNVTRLQVCIISQLCVHTPLDKKPLTAYDWLLSVIAHRDWSFGGLGNGV